MPLPRVPARSVRRRLARDLVSRMACVRRACVSLLRRRSIPLTQRVTQARGPMPRNAGRQAMDASRERPQARHEPPHPRYALRPSHAHAQNSLLLTRMRTPSFLFISSFSLSLSSPSCAEWGLPGHLPEAVCLFEMLEELDFDENAFEGELPACVGCLPFLRYDLTHTHASARAKLLPLLTRTRPSLSLSLSLPFLSSDTKGNRH